MTRLNDLLTRAGASESGAAAQILSLVDGNTAAARALGAAFDASGLAEMLDRLPAAKLREVLGEFRDLLRDMREDSDSLRDFLTDLRDLGEDIGGTLRALSDTGGAPSPADLKAVYQTVLGKDKSPDDAASAFQYGVASGDPDAESVVLWTHASPEGDGTDGPVSVYWEVATDAGFETVVDRGLGVTGPDEDHTFKVIADGLAPGGAYFYRFRVDGEWSETGKTRTLPEGDIDSVTFAVFSCVNYPAGFFNAYDAAVENGFDYSIHLGDYIYEYGPGGYATDLAEALDRVPAPANELISLDDYLARYAQYTSDEDLQALRAEAPMIMMWDDHETANDSWETGAENHNDGEGDWFARRDAGLEAYFRWNPLREPEPDETGVVDLRGHDKTYEFGDLVDLHMLETRLQAREETRADILTAITDRTAAYEDPTSTLLFEDAAVAGVPQAAVLQTLASGDAAAIETLFTGIALAGLVAEARDPGREMIGAAQLDDLVGKIEASDATWQMIGSQTLMADMALPVEVLVGFEALSEVFVRAALGLTTPQDQALLSQLDAIPSEQKVPYNFDAWDGYQAERDVILDALAASGSGGIVIAGDTHNAWTSNVRTADGTLAAVEFGGPGVTSPGFEQLVPQVLDPVTGEPIDYAADVFLRYVDDLLFANLQDRGYMDVEVTRDEVRTDYVFVSTTESRDYETETVTQIAAIDDFHIV